MRMPDRNDPLPGSGMRRALVSMIAALAFAPAPAAAQEIEVDLELVLAVDVSGSMDPREHAAQRGGYIEAFRHREVIDAITSGVTGKIAVAYVEWAGFPYQDLVVPWMVIDGAASAEAFAAALEAAPVNEFSGTSISAGLDFAAGRFDGNGVSAIRRVIDVSGDGPNNRGRPVTDARREVIARGITINGLPIVLGRAGGSLSTDLLTPYYQDCVIGGPGAFLIAVDDIDRLPEAIRRKLVLEIVSRPAPAHAAALAVIRAEATRPIDCLIGEKLRRRWYDDP